MTEPSQTVVAPSELRLEMPATPQGFAAQRDTMRSIWLLVVVLLAAGTITLHGIHRSGDFGMHDEGTHVMTGVYFADLLTDLPVSHPVQYTYEFYARYSTLGLIHWPPFFPFVEGLVFRVFGPAVLTARVTVLLFALLGLTFWFLLVRQLLGPRAAAFAALLRLYRHRALLTQEDLANRSGVSVRAIRNLESVTSLPRYSSLRLLARALRLTD